MSARQTTVPPGRGGGLLTNSGALLGGRVVVAVLGWAGTILIVRNLSPQEFGKFAFVFSLVGLMSFATDLSSSRIMVRELVRPDADRELLAGTYVCLRALLGAVAYGAAVLFVALGGYPREVLLATALAGTGLIVGSAGGALNAVFQAEVRLGHVALADVVGQVTQLAVTVAVALTHPTLLLFVLPAMAFDSVVLLWKAGFVRRLVVPRLAVRPELWRRVLRQAAPLALGHALFALSAEVPLVLLSKLSSFEAVGLFGIAVKFVTLAAFLPGALSSPLLPILVRTWPNDLATFRHTVSRALLILALAGGLVVAAFAPVAADVVNLLYGAHYRPASVAAVIAVVASCVAYSTQVAIVVLVTVGRDREYVWLGALSLALSAVGTVLLVPRHGYTGAAVAVAVAQLVVVAVIGLRALRSHALGRLPAGRMFAIAAAAAAGVGAGAAVGTVAPWPLASAASVLVFGGLVELTRAAGPRGVRTLLVDGPP